MIGKLRFLYQKDSDCIADGKVMSHLRDNKKLSQAKNLLNRYVLMFECVCRHKNCENDMGICVFYIFLSSEIDDGPVVQLYRTSDSGSEDRGLESHRGH